MSTKQGSLVVTGVNGGLGSAILGHILSDPDLAASYTGLYTVRNAATAQAVKDGALKKAPKSHSFETVEVDLSSLVSIKQAASDINRRVEKGEVPRIRVLILNAAFQEHTTLTTTKDGFDMTWQINFLANMVLTLMLLKSMDKEHGRILLVSSWSHDVEDKRNSTGGYIPYEKPWDDLFPGAEKLAKGAWSTPNDDSSWFAGYRRYGASKLCAVMFIYELASRLARDPELSNISVAAVDPGSMPSQLLRRGGFMHRVVIAQLVLPLFAYISSWTDPNGLVRPTWKSASDVISASFKALAPIKGEVLYLNGTDEIQAAKETRDEEKKKELWEYAVKASNLTKGDTVLVDWR